MITEEKLAEFERDLEDAGRIVNGGPNDTVTTREGEIVNSFSKTLNDLGVNTNLVGYAPDTALAEAVIDDKYIDYHFPQSLARYQHSVKTADAVISSTFSGWKGPFTWDQQSFQLVKIFMQIEEPADVIIVLEDAGLNELTRVQKRIEESGYHWVKFPIEITTELTTDDTLHLGFTAGTQARMMPGICSGATLPDTNLYDAYYTVTNVGTESWIAVSGNNEAAYDMDFSLYSVGDALEMPHVGILEDINNILIEEEVVTYDSKSAVHEITNSFVATPRGGGFSGWGADYNRTAGDTFDIVRLRGLRNVTASETR